MKLELLFLCCFFCCYSCSELPARKIASDSVLRLGPIDFDKITLQKYKSVSESGDVTYNFFLQTKNLKDDHVDCDPKEIQIISADGTEVPFDFDRLSTGRYFLTVKHAEELKKRKLRFVIKGRVLQKSAELNSFRPHQNFTSIKLYEQLDNRSLFHLRLSDEKNNPIESEEQPEIIFDGDGTIEDLKYLGLGVWEFSLVYPNENQIFYFSVRSQGVYFPKIYRYQYVDK